MRFLAPVMGVMTPAMIAQGGMGKGEDARRVARRLVGKGARLAVTCTVHAEGCHDNIFTLDKHSVLLCPLLQSRVFRTRPRSVPFLFFVPHSLPLTFHISTCHSVQVSDEHTSTRYTALTARSRTGNAFGSFASSVAATSARQPRRTHSSSSFNKDDTTKSTAADVWPLHSADHMHHRERENSSRSTASSAAGSGGNTSSSVGTGWSNGHSDVAPSVGHQRSFSSILSPSNLHNAGGAGDAAQNGDVGAKPFVYSREFLLGLYDQDKAHKRPIELADHDVATRQTAAGKPWALQSWRDGEKDVSIEIYSSKRTPSTEGPPS